MLTFFLNKKIQLPLSSSSSVSSISSVYGCSGGGYGEEEREREQRLYLTKSNRIRFHSKIVAMKVVEV